MYNKVIIVLLLLFITMAATTSAQDTTTIEALPNSFAVEKDQEFTINIIVNPNTAIDTVGTDEIRWDPEIAKLIDGPNRGDLFKEATVWIGGKEKDQKNGTLKFTAWGSQEDTEEQGTFITLEFKALKSGIFELYLKPEESQVASGGKSVPTTVMGNPGVPNIPSTDTEYSGGGGQPELIQLILFGGICMASLIIGVFIIFFKDKKKRKKDQEEEKSDEKKKKPHESKRKNKSPKYINEKKSNKSNVIKFQKS